MQQPVVDEIARSDRHHAGLHQRAQPGRDLVPAAAGSAARLGGPDRAAPRQPGQGVREWVEAGLKAGTLKAVVATSSLDLGVDFLPVQRVLQIGSGQGRGAAAAARRPQRPRAGPAQPRDPGAHQHAGTGGSRAARRAALAGQVEARTRPQQAAGRAGAAPGDGGAGRWLRRRRAVAEVRGAPAYRAVTRDEFDWALAFCERGGDSLTAYPEYHRIAGVDGRWRVPDRGIAKRHRCRSAPSCPTRRCRWPGSRAARIGTIEEGFIARLSQGRLLRVRPAACWSTCARRTWRPTCAGHPRRRAWCRPGPAARCRCPARWPTPCRPCWPLAGHGRCRARRSFEPETAGRAAHAAGAGAAVAHAARRTGCWWSNTARAKATTCSSTPLPAATCTSAWRSCWPGGCRGPAQHLLAQRQRPGAGDRGAPSRWTWNAGAATARLFGTHLLADVLASLNSANWRSAAFARSRAWPGWCSAATPARPRACASCRPPAACSTRSSASTTPATGCWRPGREPRCWRRSWTCSTWRTLQRLAGCRLDIVDLRAPSPFACR
jgi:hypothetical protein